MRTCWHSSSICVVWRSFSSCLASYESVVSSGRASAASYDVSDWVEVHGPYLLFIKTGRDMGGRRIYFPGDSRSLERWKCKDVNAKHFRLEMMQASSIVFKICDKQSSIYLGFQIAPPVVHPSIVDCTNWRLSCNVHTSSLVSSREGRSDSSIEYCIILFRVVERIIFLNVTILKFTVESCHSRTN